MKNTHSVILSKWIVDDKVCWPVGISALRAIELDKDPEESWKRFPHVDNKLQTDKEDICYQYMSYPTSEIDDQYTQCETQERLDDDIGQMSPEFSPPRRERKRSASPDYIEPSPQKSPRRSLFKSKSRETRQIRQTEFFEVARWSHFPRITLETTKNRPKKMVNQREKLIS